MALSGKPSATEFQVGADVYFMYNNMPRSAKLAATTSEVTNPNSDSNGLIKEVYHLEGYTQVFTASQLYSRKEILLGYIASLLDIPYDIPTLEP